MSLVNNLKDGWIRCSPEEGSASNKSSSDRFSLFGVALLLFFVCLFVFVFFLLPNLSLCFT